MTRLHRLDNGSNFQNSVTTFCRRNLKWFYLPG